MRKWMAAALATGALQGAVIRGVVVEHETGRPLARTLVVAAPVPGKPGTPASVRTDRVGAFAIQVAGGAYLISASRRSFAPAQYGQKRWKGAGVPLILEELGSTTIQIRMHRFGSIAGTVVDENDVGLPEQDVAVYRNTRPPQSVAKGATDDRGMYRIGGLEPGSYLVRALGKQYDDAGYLPTFARETARVDEARPVDVQLDEQITGIGVRPFPGQLFRVTGRAVTFPPGPVTVTLTSDTGSLATVSANDGSFEFRPMPPGSYELTATAPLDRRTNSGMQAAWMPVVVDRDRADFRLNLNPLPELRITVEDTKGSPVDLQNVSIFARRKDASGESKPETLRSAQSRTLLPGRWDLALMTPQSYYVSGFSGPSSSLPSGRPNGWNEVLLPSGAPVAVKFTLSASPGTIRGTVVQSGRPVVGAPVFLDPHNALGVRSTRTDLRGQYRFAGLAPGTYRVLSTFEFQVAEPAAMDAANPATVNVEEGRESVLQLELYVM